MQYILLHWPIKLACLHAGVVRSGYSELIKKNNVHIGYVLDIIIVLQISGKTIVLWF